MPDLLTMPARAHHDSTRALEHLPQVACTLHLQQNARAASKAGTLTHHSFFSALAFAFLSFSGMAANSRRDMRHLPLASFFFLSFSFCFLCDSYCRPIEPALEIPDTLAVTERVLFASRRGIILGVVLGPTPKTPRRKARGHQRPLWRPKSKESKVLAGATFSS